MALAGKSSAKGERVPRLGPGVDPTALPLTPAEGYLLSRVDGRTPWRVLREIGGLSPAEVDRCLERWLADAVLVVDGAASRRASARASTGEKQAPPRASAPPAAPARAPRAGAQKYLQKEPQWEFGNFL